MPRARDYSRLLKGSGLSPTPHRLKVLEIIGSSPSPVSHREIYMSLRDSHPIDRVTVYRILDLLVEKELVVRISSGDRSFRYGLASTVDHSQHPHFFCSSCGYMGCLDQKLSSMDLGPILASLPGLVSRVEVRLDGICNNCLNSRQSK